MVPAAVAMIVIMVIAIIVLAVVILGMQGTGRHRTPEVSHTLARVGQHLNGEAEPPRGLVALFEEAGEGADDIRQLPENIRRRSAASAASARTALSARTARSARSARSAATPPPADEVQDPTLAPESARTSARVVEDSAWGSTEVQSAWEERTSQQDAEPSEAGSAEPERARRPRSARWFRSPGPDARAATTATTVAAGSAVAAASWGDDSATEAAEDAAETDRPQDGAGTNGEPVGDSPQGPRSEERGPASGDDLELAEEFSLLAGLDEESERRPEDGPSAWAEWSDSDD